MRKLSIPREGPFQVIKHHGNGTVSYESEPFKRRQGQNQEDCPLQMEESSPLKKSHLGLGSHRLVNELLHGGACHGLGTEIVPFQADSGADLTIHRNMSYHTNLSYASYQSLAPV